jgi:hypothetical protein
MLDRVASRTAQMLISGIIAFSSGAQVVLSEV